MAPETLVLIVLGLYSVFGAAVIVEKYRYLHASHGLLQRRRADRSADLTAQPALHQVFDEVHKADSQSREAVAARELAVLADRATAGMVYLATIGNTAPFVGLFGTVLGIMRAFKDIAGTGSAGFEAVSIGLSQALIATAAGLGVAVPAVIFYNYFGRRIQSHLLEVRYTLERELEPGGK